MCRLVVALGRFNNAGDTLVGIGNSLVQAASMDPHGKRFLNEERHEDGWGGFCSLMLLPHLRFIIGA